MQNCEVGSGTGTYSQRGSQGGRPTQRGFRRSLADRPRGSGATRRPRALGKRLQHLKELLDVLPLPASAWAYAEPRVRPNCKVYACPERAVGGSASQGLSKEGNSQNQGRRGLSGIPRSALQAIDDTLALMEDFRERCALWTVTLPDEDYAFMVGTDIWPRFQRRLVDLLVRYLKEVGDEALVLAVVEIGNVRATRTKRPMPHIHIATTGWGRRHPGGGYVLCPSRMDALVHQAALYAGLPSQQREASSNVQGIKKSVRNYLSKYLTKNKPTEGIDLNDGWDALVPHQWWNRSRGARALVMGHMFRLPAAFAAFIVQRQNQLEGLGLGRAGNVTIGFRKTITGDLPIEVFMFDFRTPENLHQALELYVLWEAEQRYGPPRAGGGGLVP